MGEPRRSDPLTGARYATSPGGYIAGTTRTIRCTDGSPRLGPRPATTIPAIDGAP